MSIIQPLEGEERIASLREIRAEVEAVAAMLGSIDGPRSALASIARDLATEITLDICHEKRKLLEGKRADEIAAAVGVKGAF